MLRTIVAASALVVAFVAGAAAQVAVTGAADTEALFRDANPKLNANKQVAYHIEKDLLEANHWDLAPKLLTERYIQHNPNAQSGRDGVLYYFTQVLKVQPKPIEKKLKAPVVAVLSQGDLVVVVTPRTLKDPKDPSKTYSTTWFDMWRIKDGRADEHWDPAEKR